MGEIELDAERQIMTKFLARIDQSLTPSNLRRNDGA